MIYFFLGLEDIKEKIKKNQNMRISLALESSFNGKHRAGFRMIEVAYISVYIVSRIFSKFNQSKSTQHK